MVQNRATHHILSDESNLVMVRKFEKLVEVDSDDEDGDDTIEANDACLEKPTSIELRSVIETLMHY